MRENREIFHAREFQAIYKDTPPSRRYNTTAFNKSMDNAQQLPSKEQNMECMCVCACTHTHAHVLNRSGHVQLLCHRMNCSLSGFFVHGIS